MAKKSRDRDHGNAPPVSLPNLPAGRPFFDFWGADGLRADANYVEAHAELLAARGGQARAMAALMLARVDLGLAIAKFRTLPELARHAYELGRENRLHELRMAQLENEATEVEAEVRLAQVRRQLAALRPPLPSAPNESGLSTADIERVLQQFPDVPAEAIAPILMAIRGLMAERKS